MKQADLLIHHASELLTLAGNSDRPKTGDELNDLGIIKDGAVAACEGKIVAVGPSDDVFDQVELLPHAEVFDARGKVVMPCFVEPHAHLVFGGSRQGEFLMKIQGKTYLEILQAGGGILSTVQMTRNATYGELLAGARRRLNIFASHGVGTVEAKSGYGLTVEDELRMLRVCRELNESHPLDVVPTFLGAHAVPQEYRGGREDEYVELVVEQMIPAVARENLAEFCDVFCDVGAFDLVQSEAILEAGKRHGLLPKMHADELASFGAAELAAKVGAVSADHLLKASDEGIRALADAGVVAVLLPGTAFFLGEEFAKARKMIDAGVAVALSTDRNPGSCPTEATHLILTLACIRMKMTPAEAISAATINAAHALRRGRIVGSLESGKQADIVIMDAPDHNYIPYHYGTSLVNTVFKKGHVIYRSRI